jgi:PAS domain S-box-containing protein
MWNTIASSARIDAVMERALRVEALRGTIVRLDEVLTMSARMAAATGDPEWEARYRLVDPQLTAAITEAQSLAPTVDSKDVVARTEAANRVLVQMEHHAFDLVRQRRLADARAALVSDEYVRQKGIYAAGMDTLNLELKESVRSVVAAEMHRTWIVRLVSVAAVLLLVLCWIVALRTIHRWRVALLANQERLSIQSAELAQLNAGLDHKVAERTAEVESSRAVALLHLEAAQRARAAAEAAEQDILVANQEVKASRDRLEAVVDSAPLAILTIDLTGLVKTWNPAATLLFGWPSDEVVGRPLPTIPAAGQAAYEGLLSGYQRAEAVTNIETTRRRKDGSLVDVVLSAAPILDSHGRPLGALGVYADITQRKQLEQQLRQAQKMEAIGQLAGGVAHDFNNLLTVIGGRSSLLLQTMPPDDRARRSVELIERTSERAAGLTRQLLAFSRKQVLAPKALDLNTLVDGVMPMLRRLIGEQIEVVVVPGRDVGHVMADAGQMEQVVMNLVVNARDAMPEGGMVKIETGCQAVQGDRLHSQGQVPPGQYITLTVQDTGTGMDPATLARMFDPFFTTKDPGAGTGLGLSTVHGIVHQSGGYIAVDSTLGRGTTFTIYLPRIAEPAAVTDASKDTPQALMRGTETVLLVEDQEDVRKVSSEILHACGYTVLETGDPLEALTMGERPNGAIDLLVTDMVMPGMGGAELATRLETESPELRVLCVSGYADQVAVAADHQPPRAFLLKPFTPDDLAKKVHETLMHAPTHAPPL